jgi:DNA-binding transcriptional LysR family regulator
VSTSFGQAQLADAIAEYVKRYPLVTVDLQMLDRTVNLVDERIDLAIRTSNDLDPNLIARRLTVCRSVVCAAPAYLREHPAPQQSRGPGPAQLPDPLVFRQKPVAFRKGRRTHVGAGARQHHRQRGQHVVARDTGRRRRGDAAHLPGRDYIRRGELVRLLPDAEPRHMNIYAVYASRKHMPAALRSLLDFLVQRFPEEPVWDIGL